MTPKLKQVFKIPMLILILCHGWIFKILFTKMSVALSHLYAMSSSQPWAATNGPTNGRWWVQDRCHRVVRRCVDYLLNGSFLMIMMMMEEDQGSSYNPGALLKT